MALKISVSFKESEKGMYDFLLSQLSPSIFVKGLLKEKMEVKKEIVVEKKQNNEFKLDF